MAGRPYKDLADFLQQNQLGHLVGAFFERGVRRENFHCLTKAELARMRVTNSATVKRLLGLARRRANLKAANRPGSAPPGGSGAAAARSAAAHSTSQSLGASSLRTAQSVNQTGAAGLSGDASQLSALGHESPLPKQPFSGTPALGAAANQAEPEAIPGAADRSAPAAEPVYFKPTAAHCVRQVAVRSKPTPMRSLRLARRIESVQSGGDSGLGHTHTHGSQGKHCFVCAAMNMASASVEDKVSALRGSLLQFPTATMADPVYPDPENFALRFRLGQCDVDWHEVQLRVWTEEDGARKGLQKWILEELYRIRSRALVELIGTEQDVRAATLEEETDAWNRLLAQAAESCAGISMRMRHRSYTEALEAQRQCMGHAEAYERQCIEVEEDVSHVYLIEIGAHLSALVEADRRQRAAQLKALNVRDRCPVCYRIRCPFYRHPWRPWNTRGTELQPDARPSNAAVAGIQRHGSFFKDQETARNVDKVTGLCHGYSLLHEFEAIQSMLPPKRVKRLRGLFSRSRNASPCGDDPHPSPTAAASCAAAQREQEVLQGHAHPVALRKLRNRAAAAAAAAAPAPASLGQPPADPARPAPAPAPGSAPAARAEPAAAAAARSRSQSPAPQGGAVVQRPAAAAPPAPCSDTVRRALDAAAAAATDPGQLTRDAI
eukprot:TRINITY_DN4904_c1_g1_i1.p1 TRINITY_DN4904_c1_g1~~TRINITY_DN4904_c1_g1_i1.p1  ORF type:complete len:698 (+),score=190.23 TRINITY_DN4904_c1_g1_i1:106-2094(+)